LTHPACSRMLKSMRCLSFAACAALLLPSPSDAQSVPGRDLLRYPLGTLAEAPALATETGEDDGTSPENRNNRSTDGHDAAIGSCRGRLRESIRGGIGATFSAGKSRAFQSLETTPVTGVTGHQCCVSRVAIVAGRGPVRALLANRVRPASGQAARHSRRNTS